MHSVITPWYTVSTMDTAPDAGVRYVLLKLRHIISTKYSNPELGYTVIAADYAPGAVVDSKHSVLCSYSGAHNEYNKLSSCVLHGIVIRGDNSPSKYLGLPFLKKTSWGVKLTPY